MPLKASDWCSLSWTTSGCTGTLALHNCSVFFLSSSPISRDSLLYHSTWTSPQCLCQAGRMVTRVFLCCCGNDQCCHGSRAHRCRSQSSSVFLPVSLFRTDWYHIGFLPRWGQAWTIVSALCLWNSVKCTYFFQLASQDTDYPRGSGAWEEGRELSHRRCSLTLRSALFKKQCSYCPTCYVLCFNHSPCPSLLAILPIISVIMSQGLVSKNSPMKVSLTFTPERNRYTAWVTTHTATSLKSLLGKYLPNSQDVRYGSTCYGCRNKRLDTALAPFPVGKTVV